MSLKAVAICAFFHMQNENGLQIKPEVVDIICKNAELIVEYSDKNHINPELILSLMWSESRFQPEVISNVGACGMMQIIPKWSDHKTCAQLQIPDVNIAEGIRQLKFWIDDYGKGSVEKGLCGYAAGYKCKESNKATKYAKKVISRSNKLNKNLQKLSKLIHENQNFKRFIEEKYDMKNNNYKILN